MNAEKIAYRNIPAQDSHVDDDQFENVPRTHVGSLRARKYLWYLIQAALLCTIAAQGIAIMFLSQAEKDSCRSVHGMPLKRTEPRTIYQHSKYISSDEEEASKAWDAILPGHGVVAIEPEYARSKKLPETVILPDSGGKLTFVIEAYHAIHCVTNLRKHYVALERNETRHWSASHDRHCFDALRQYIMCNIDDTLLKTWGKRDAGHDQEKKCHDWDRLRAWAEERSANYFDAEPGTGTRHIGNYHAGDGLPVGSLR
ncbi:hypothetical protein HBI56_059040 [Parastagonospora nodorum]|uniref:Tat pathway signal sequence n=2 Tax=Phaeosphaeria nodorum (strain SN15 / ATCC MYA-4574 / FGSC 10173) TaxID=321614 RepID=A0A7U2F288_PHANO|nr:hypothetical protein SNOG_08926 [Parastagonospora nodorum SN15]KAH3909675.1 hypothetical protein HBH56_159600 [Parastagonospora nodorum]EAT84094.1 hypothetical protein SNOG_08926 [Parastagonospora nodorum SN15]KAH3922416.1 hypothetical protein HBH54_224030 [Parastagonospora nodorum]KAH4002358.1 hypothetical protein HBI10_071880 [Parastagonospora nodorum]KAH4018108.1 hypothetical protein HBI13_139270 [Parastagonospora nodorum]